jgi:ubiquitin thioesterase protein OTUB1
MGNMLDHIGYSRDIWIDFADGAFELLRKLADSLQRMDGLADQILLETFNDMNESMSIITYIKVRTPCPPPLHRRLTPAAACQCLGADAPR